MFVSGGSGLVCCWNRNKWNW